MLALTPGLVIQSLKFPKSVCPCHRPQRKLLHAALHTIAVTAVALGLVAAFNSHTLKRPVPTPNLYSPHSYLGLTTLVLLSAQVMRTVMVAPFRVRFSTARDGMLHSIRRGAVKV